MGGLPRCMQDFGLQKKTGVPLQDGVMFKSRTRREDGGQPPHARKFPESFSVTLKNEPLPTHLRPPASNNAAVSVVELRVETGDRLARPSTRRCPSVLAPAGTLSTPFSLIYTFLSFQPKSTLYPINRVGRARPTHQNHYVRYYSTLHKVSVDIVMADVQ
jgi:hypothetical protein